MAFAAGQADREKVARGKASALEPKLMRLKITVQSAAASAGVEVKRDGAVVSPALWGTPVPLDPGPAQGERVGPGKEPWEVTVQLDQPGSTVNVDVPPLLDRKPGAVGRGAGAPPPPQAAPAAPPGPRRACRRSRSPRRARGRCRSGSRRRCWASGARRGRGLRRSWRSRASTQSNQPGGGCDATTNKCTPAGLAQRSDAVSKGNIGTGVFVAGAVLGAGGDRAVGHPAAHPRGRRRGASGSALRRAAPQVGVGPTGASLRGAF